MKRQLQPDKLREPPAHLTLAAQEHVNVSLRDADVRGEGTFPACLGDVDLDGGRGHGMSDIIAHFFSNQSHR